MNQEDLVRRLRRYARKRKLFFNWQPDKGKGSHGWVTVGDKSTIIQHGELDPWQVARVCKQLGIDPADI